MTTASMSAYPTLSGANTFTNATNVFPVVTAQIIQFDPPTSKTLLTQLGYKLEKTQSVFNSWTTASITNLYTMGPFASTGSYPFGTYLMNARITIRASTPGLACCVTTSNGTSIVGPCWDGSAVQKMVIGGVQYITVELNYIFSIYSAQSLYLNAQQNYTPFTVDSSCYFSITRIG